VIMLTAKGEQEDRIRGLETGADDYLSKPFSPRELVLRVQAIFRRTETKLPGDALLEVDGFSVDRAAFVAKVNGLKLDLTQTEFKLLSLLLERRGKIQSRDTLLHEVWGYQNSMDTRTVDTHVRRLREKLGPSSNRIETIRGAGYRFVTATEN
jgi:DNA-binding response OmpR family regulator